MTVGNANDDFDDELLSAYVDGELTAAERALVEARLRSDPAAAALVEELRSLSSAIKSLPRETLGRDLRAGVLAEVEQARADLDRHGPATLPMTTVDRRQGIRRGLVWSALAIAAALVVAVFQPAEVNQDDRELARAEKREAEVEKLNRPERQLRAIGGEGGRASTDKVAEGTLAADAKALPPGLRASMSSGGVDGSVAAEGKEKAMAAVPASAPAPDAGAPLLGEAAPAEPLMLDAAEQDALAAGAPAEGAAETALAKDEAADLQASSEGAALQDLPAKPPAAMQTPLAAALPQGEAEASGEPLAMGGGGAFGPRGGAMGGAGGEVKSVEEARGGGQAAGAAAAPTAKVTLKLASADGALRFKQLLAESDIAPADDAVAKKEMAGRRADRFAESRAFGRSTIDAKQDAEVQEERSLYFYSFDSIAPSADAADGAKLGVELESVRGMKQPASNLVWVEATPAQIDALLEKCRDDKAAFAAVLSDDMLLLAKKAESGAAEMKLKRAARAEQATSEPKSEIAASEKRERVLFVLEPATPALESTVSPETSEAR